jgi:hypothetical protein
MHGHNSPHLGETVVRKARCVEVEPIRELAGLRQEQEGEAELGDDGNGAAAPLLLWLRGEKGETGEMRRWRS